MKIKYKKLILGIFLVMILKFPSVFAFQTEHNLSHFHHSVYRIFIDSLAIHNIGGTPIVFLDIDDTLIRTAYRYLEVIEALNDRFQIFPPWSRPKTPDWTASYHLTPEDIVYASSFEDTLRLTLEKLINRPEELAKLYAPNDKGVPESLQIFFQVFFDPTRVEKDIMFSGSVFFLNNLLSMMKKIGGKVVFLSGRADKYTEITKKSLIYNGIVPSLLNGPYVLWYLKPSSGKINFSEDISLDFRNDKSAVIHDILKVDPRLKVVGFVDNEARNIFSVIGTPQLTADNIYFFRSADATWKSPEDAAIVANFLDRTKNQSAFFTQFDSFRIRADQAAVLKALFAQEDISYMNDANLADVYAIKMAEVRKRRPTLPQCRQLTTMNTRDCATILDLICP